MSDTTAYLAGCATTGVAALVLLVARVGMVSANSEDSRATRLNDRIARVEAQLPNQTETRTRQSQNDQLTEQNLEYEIRRELEKQQALTQELEDQLEQQEALSSDLEAQIRAQEEETKELLDQMQYYSRSVEDMEIDDRIAAASRPVADSQPTPPVSLIWLGAGAVVVLVLGGSGLIACAVVLILQSQRRSSRPIAMPPMPMPPAPGYRYYSQPFLPPPQIRPRRPSYYDYPTPPYDYNS